MRRQLTDARPIKRKQYWSNKECLDININPECEGIFLCFYPNRVRCSTCSYLRKQKWLKKYWDKNRKQLNENKRKAKKVDIKCGVCKKNIPLKSKRKKYCSLKCYKIKYRR